MDGTYSPAYFLGATEDEFVEEFEKIARREGNSIAALLLVGINNPMMYELSESAARRIDAIAQRYGIQVVVDDILRAVNPRGMRDTVARHFTSPIIVEGSNKRFGDGMWNSVYILAKGGAVPYIQHVEGTSSPNEDKLFGRVLKDMLANACDPCHYELEQRNQAFDEGLLRYAHEAKIIRPSSTFLTSLIILPGLKSAMEFTKQLYLSRDGPSVTIMPMDSFYADRYRMPAAEGGKFRITVGREEPDGLREAGETIGKAFIDGYSSLR